MFEPEDLVRCSKAVIEQEAVPVGMRREVARYIFVCRAAARAEELKMV